MEYYRYYSLFRLFDYYLPTLLDAASFSKAFSQNHDL